MSTKRVNKRAQRATAQPDAIYDTPPFDGDVRPFADQSLQKVTAFTAKEDHDRRKPDRRHQWFKSLAPLTAEEDGHHDASFHQQDTKGRHKHASCMCVVTFICLLGTIAIAACYLYNTKMVISLHQGRLDLMQSLLHNHTSQLHSHPAIISIIEQVKELSSKSSHLESSLIKIKHQSSAHTDQITALQSTAQQTTLELNEGRWFHNTSTASTSDVLNISQAKIVSNVVTHLDQSYPHISLSRHILPARVVKHSPLPPGQPFTMRLLSALTAITHLNLFPAVTSKLSSHLQSLVPMPGRCLPLRGSKGYVVLQLPTGSSLTGLYIHHPISRTSSASTTPRLFRVLQLHPPVQQIPKNQGISGTAQLGEFLFDVDGPEVQRFTFNRTVKAERVRFELLSNHGSKEYTCIYTVMFTGSMDRK